MTYAVQIDDEIEGTALKTIVLSGERLTLRPVTIEDASDDYLSWLNDPEVNRYSHRAGTTETMSGLRAWLSEPTENLRLAIVLGDRHIGGISLNSITDDSAELAIMIGARDTWGHGYGTEAIQMLTDYGHNVMGLRRIWAQSPNPAFNATMRRLGWLHEGTKHSALNGMDVECWASVLADQKKS